MEIKKKHILWGALAVLICVIIMLLTMCNGDKKKGDEGDVITSSDKISLEQITVSNEIGENVGEVSTGDNVSLEETNGSDKNMTLEEDTSSDKLISSDEMGSSNNSGSNSGSNGGSSNNGSSNSSASNSDSNSDSNNSSANSSSNSGSNNSSSNNGGSNSNSNGTGNSSKPSSSDKPTDSNKPVIPEETEAQTDSKFNIALTAPKNVLVNQGFEISVAATNCAHIEWYINGAYDATLEKKINPKGTLKFDKTGIYRITVIGYTEDWQENVSANISVRVYNDLSQANGNAKEHDRAMYSWDHDFIYERNESMLQKVMELTECNILYQEVSSNADARDVAAFLQRRGEKGQTVYYLCGNASWAIEEDGASMLREVQRAIDYNRAAGEYKFVGIQFDVEPYCLTDFEENADKYMAQYVKNSKLAYKAAHEAGLLVEICIPYWWDSSYGYYEELEDLIANACDSVAVMNYYKKDKEAEHIETEVELCKKYNKPIINITETIPPGLHGLTENNTYYHDGIDAIEEMWNTLDGYFQYEKLGYSFHWLEVIIELLGLG